MERAGINHLPEEHLLLLPCACANIRRAARAVTRLYNQELQPAGIEITQFTLLMALQTAGPSSQGKLGDLLALDSTSLTRMLAPLKTRGWVRAQKGDDGRLKIFQLTPAGRDKFQQASRHWKRAQKHLKTILGHETWDKLGGLLSEITRAAAGTPESSATK